MKVDTPRIDKPQLTTQLNAAYSLDFAGLRFLPVGEDGYSYLAETTGGARYFVKAYPASDARHAETLERAFRLTAWLRDARRCRFVLAPRLARDAALCLRHSNFVVAMFDYVDGATAMDEPLDDEAWLRLASHMAALHCSAGAFPSTLSIAYEVFDVPFGERLRRLFQVQHRPATEIGHRVMRLLAQQREDILATLERLEAMQASGRRDVGALVLTHGDPNEANVLADRQGNLHLIDWGEIALGPPERDLVFFTGPRFEPFLWAYVRAHRPAMLREHFFTFYLYRWILQEIDDYAHRILRIGATGEEEEHYWSEFSQYVPINHGDVDAGRRAIRDVLDRVLCG